MNEEAETQVLLADHTTFHIGGPAGEFVTAENSDELVAAIQDADTAGTPVLVLSGGSNTLVSDAGFDGRVVHVASRGIEHLVDSDDSVVLRVQAGEPWDAFVALSVIEQLSGLAALSGIPGLVGSTPVQNVGAYGGEVAAVIRGVRAYDRHIGEVREIAPAQCEFGYRTSVFKRSRRPAEPTGRWVILDVDIELTKSPLSEPIAYAELARHLDAEIGQRAPSDEVRAAVLELRHSKGMVYDPSDHDSWSAGSFFTNPFLNAELAAALPEDAPRFEQPDGTVKSSAAWLIDHAGFGKGFGDGPARLSTKHVLALTNRGTASAADVVALARQIRDQVLEQFGVELVPEPTLVGVTI